ncbi:Three-deoxy-D-manno-octulosonic-acid transferase domain protein [Allochromatium vinosum DSM 180]|uniref:3-deoxy-D-manno-octulosonic acid transferase n=2 Tax=Allochromatium vinosum TaxID=1049 RepID=D3RTY7_ALLVD|nr:Three-deoxy-D-manno-octulosonic-acid transferase domain protein [Allochromatium vinosum DSM 180]
MSGGMALRLYTALWRLALPLVLARLYWRGRTQPAYRQRIGERLVWDANRKGEGEARTSKADIWIHAVSVGEVQAAEPLIRRLLESEPARTILVTTTTPTGAERLRALFSERVAHLYTPFDLPSLMARFIERVAPRFVIVMETEIWPNMLAALERRSIPVALVNARLSERSARGYARLARLTRPTLARFALIAAQASADAERFVALGAPRERVQVMGSLKFDLVQPEDLATRAAEMRRLWGAGRPVWIAASTHEGEEIQVLQAHRRLLEHRPDALLVLVPRHPERFDAVAALIARQGLEFARRSQERAVAPSESVCLGDSMGELTCFLAAGDLAFIGGSLVPRGGHNPLEAAASGIPVILGPHTFNFAAIARMLYEAGAAEQVKDAEALSQCLIDLLDDAERRACLGARGREVVELNRGALERLLTALAPWLVAPAASDQSAEVTGERD